jgi:uncharacterized protein YjbI with pentapeptide repeats
MAALQHLEQYSVCMACGMLTNAAMHLVLQLPQRWAARLLGVDWTGLDWTGLDWTGLDWTGLDWTGLDWTGLDWTGLDWTYVAATA